VSDKYDHKIKRDARCQWMNKDGKQCRRRAVWSESIHENPEFMDSGWFMVDLCEKHHKNHSAYDND